MRLREKDHAVGNASVSLRRPFPNTHPFRYGSIRSLLTLTLRLWRKPVKYILVIPMLLIAAGCQSNLSQGSPNGSTIPTNPSAKHLIWEPPPVVASNGSDRTVTFTVSSQCSPVPYSPSSGTIHGGSVIPIDFNPNGNPCSYQSVSIKATDNPIIPQDECDLLVVGDNIDVIDYSNTNCGLAYLGSGTWGFTYKLVSSAQKRVRR